jgi:hypothetical protein
MYKTRRRFAPPKRISTPTRPIFMGWSRRGDFRPLRKARDSLSHLLWHSLRLNESEPANAAAWIADVAIHLLTPAFLAF